MVQILLPVLNMKLGFTWRQQLGRSECPYMERWVLNFGRFGSIRLHHWFRSDDKRATHDHPSDFITLVLKGEYTDIHWPHTEDETLLLPEPMTPGMIRRRKAEHRHIVDVHPPGCWTLLYFFPERRNWGFWVPRKLDGKLKFKKANKYFLEHGHHPCNQP